MTRSLLILLAVLTLSLPGCVTSGGNTSAGRGKVQIIDSKTRVHNQATLDHADFQQFAENITNKMLASDLVASWGDKRPRFIVGNVLNNSKEDGIRYQDITLKIEEVLMNSGLVRIMDRSATKFDYLVSTALNSESEIDPESKEQIVSYYMVMKLSKLDGEVVGQWSDSLKMVKAGRSLF